MQWHLLVVDIQDAFAPHITGWDAVTSRARIMIEAARKLDAAVTATEQYPERLGPTIAPVKAALDGLPIFPKTAFSSLRVPEVLARITDTRPVHLLLVGIEAHVCVLQTALDALALPGGGVTPYVLVDAVSSRRPLDRDTAFRRLECAGAVLSTVESAIFEMLGRAGTARFKSILPLVK